MNYVLFAKMEMEKKYWKSQGILLVGKSGNHAVALDCWSVPT